MQLPRILSRGQFHWGLEMRGLSFIVYIYVRPPPQRHIDFVQSICLSACPPFCPPLHRWQDLRNCQPWVYGSSTTDKNRVECTESGQKSGFQSKLSYPMGQHCCGLHMSEGKSRIVCMSIWLIKHLKMQFSLNSCNILELHHRIFMLPKAPDMESTENWYQLLLKWPKVLNKWWNIKG